MKKNYVDDMVDKVSLFDIIKLLNSYYMYYKNLKVGNEDSDYYITSFIRENSDCTTAQIRNKLNNLWSPVIINDDGSIIVTTFSDIRRCEVENNKSKIIKVAEELKNIKDIYNDSFIIDCNYNDLKVMFDFDKFLCEVYSDNKLDILINLNASNLNIVMKNNNYNMVINDLVDFIKSIYIKQEDIPICVFSTKNECKLCGEVKKMCSLN